MLLPPYAATALHLSISFLLTIKINEVTALEAIIQLCVCTKYATGCHSVASELTQMCISNDELGIANDSAHKLVMDTA